MKKVFLLFVAAFMAISLSAQVPQVISVSSELSFQEVYQQVLKLNEKRFANLNKIQVGDSVMFPSLSGAGTEFLVANEPVSGVHDCLYRMTKKYMAGQLETKPVEKIVKTKPQAPVQELSIFSSDWFCWGLIAFLIAVTILFIVLFYRYIRSTDINTNPVISGGLSNNPVEAAAQITALSGSRVVKSERGRLICAHPVKVQMNFSDGIKKVKLISGEEYYRITQEDGVVRYARRACGNLINGSISELPDGVTFVPSTEETATWTAEKKEIKNPENEVTTENEENLPEFHFHFPEENEIATILEAAGMMMNVPSKITYKDLVIEFAPQVEKEKAEDK